MPLSSTMRAAKVHCGIRIRLLFLTAMETRYSATQPENWAILLRMRARPSPRIWAQKENSKVGRAVKGGCLRIAFLSVVILAFAFSVAAQSQHLTARQAKDHIGQVQTVCGKVVSTHYADRSKGQPTFLNLDEPYPNEIFTVVIWGSDRGKFGAPETAYRDKGICVTGKITSYRGLPEIAASSPSQIEVEK
jgi:hypothetical protein